MATDDGDEHDVVMKISNGPECTIEGLANEMLGSLLAADLELPVNEPFLVRIDDEFVSSVSNEAIRQRMRGSSQVAFASKHAGKQWRRWGPSDRISDSQIGLALSILTFDACIANSDRSPANSNMLVKDQLWRLIDHESAFGFRMKVFPRCEPWKSGNLELLKRYGTDSEHIFAKQLAKNSDLAFEAIQAKWEGLSDIRIAQYDATLPAEWSEVRPILTEALDHIKKVRDQIGSCVTELRRVLS
ncbi:HipA family kinase [Rhizobium sp. 21-4511-3d]